MSDVVIRVEKLSKQYRIGGKREPYKTFRDTLTNVVISPWRRTNALLRGTVPGMASDHTIWALRDASFDVTQSEVVGIIGRNGAGKSTLLKILTRITEPTQGRAVIRGRVGSLLEVGTGFHPELTGRENVYLYGAILGMKRSEIRQKFDEIVAFAETETFIDTPMKHYSSGMQVRLAFAVAAHLDPEVLIVDEVLAVGDASFQRKCLNKMQEFGERGRTILFVSHNMEAVSRMCDRVVLLDEGKVVLDGPTREVISFYMSSDMGTTALQEWPDPTTAPGGDIARLRAVRARTADGRIMDTVDIREPLSIEMEYEVLKSGHALLPNFYFWNEEGICAFGAQDLDPTWRRRPRPAGRYVSSVRIPGNLLSDGMLFVNVNLGTLEPYCSQFQVRSAVSFQVLDNLDGNSARGDYAGRMLGVVRPQLQWCTQFSPNGTKNLVDQEVSA